MSVKKNTKTNTNKNANLPKKDYSKQISDYNKAIAQAEASLENMQAEVDLKTRQIEELETAVGELEEIVSGVTTINETSWSEFLTTEGLWSCDEWENAFDIAKEGIERGFEAYVDRLEEIKTDINNKIKELEEDIRKLNISISSTNIVVNGLYAGLNNVKTMNVEG